MTAMDLLPTFAKLAGAKVPSDRVIDGRDVSAVLRGEAKSPHEEFFYHKNVNLVAVRSGDWKLHTEKGKPAQLYNLKKDLGETNDVAQGHPEVVKQIEDYLRNARTESEHWKIKQS